MARGQSGWKSKARKFADLISNDGTVDADTIDGQHASEFYSPSNPPPGGSPVAQLSFTATSSEGLTTLPAGAATFNTANMIAQVTATAAGYVWVEMAGARGGIYGNSGNAYGRGGKVFGYLYFDVGDSFEFHIGQNRGGNSPGGGGASALYPIGSPNTPTLVAAGGAGSGEDNRAGGNGGGLEGTGDSTRIGTQTKGGDGFYNSYGGNAGGFRSAGGARQNSYASSGGAGWCAGGRGSRYGGRRGGGGGGGGYYGGSTTGHGNGGGGGSSFMDHSRFLGSATTSTGANSGVGFIKFRSLNS